MGKRERDRKNYWKINALEYGQGTERGEGARAGAPPHPRISLSESESQSKAVRAWDRSLILREWELEGGHQQPAPCPLRR